MHDGLRLTGAQVLTETGLREDAVSVIDGVFAEAVGREIDLRGYQLLPGIIDLHGDGFERHLAPRRGVLGELSQGLAALDAELGASGVTTAVLAQFVSWEGGMRGPDFASDVTQAVSVFPARTDLRIQLRLEINLLEEYQRVKHLVETHGVRYVVFNDHLPHKALAAGKRPPRLTGQALKSGRSPEAHLALLQALHTRRDAVPEALEQLAAELMAMGVTLGSHDDPTPAARNTARSMGAAIAEFPETLETAESACAAGDAVIMGAPNVVRGGSHDKKVAARDVIAAGAVTALVSDYHYPSLAQAALLLAREGMDLTAAWALISSGPAAVMGWRDRGRIAPGLRADLVILGSESGRIEGCFAGGQVSFLAGDLAQRFLRDAA